MESNLHKESAYPPLKVIIAGGGTGGHLFPGIALAEAFQLKNPATKVLFAGTGNRMEKIALGRTLFMHRHISAGGLKGKTWRDRVRALCKVGVGFLESLNIIRQFRPDLVVGVGGYVSGPMVLSARLSRVPSVLHEQNMIPGLTNRLLAMVVKRIYVTFPQTRLRGADNKIAVTGNPIRKSMAAMAPAADADLSVSSPTEKQFTVLVFGGSQGAHTINCAVTEALTHLPKRNEMFFIHQTGEADERWVQETYLALGVRARVQAFFFNMAEQYAAADLVICRAGATTIAEVATVGKGAIFIPYPFAADDHQTKNAQGLLQSGAAEMILEKHLTGRGLAEKIDLYRKHPGRLQRMASTAASYGRPRAAEDIVEDCYRILGGTPAD